MNLLACLLALVLHVGQGEKIAHALDSARVVYARSGENTTIYIAPGTYYEELTIDVPGLRLINAARRPSIALRDSGVGTDPSAVRISWYYGHGYQYRSMGDTFNYGGKRTRCWNATVLVTAPDFYAEHIIFENSFNQYISPAEAADLLTDISQARVDWTEKERPKRTMPVRPKQVGSTEVQHKRYIERAAAISFTATAQHAVLRECRCVGHQDVLYGDQGASVYIDGGVLQGGVDFLFGGLCMAVDRATIVVNVSTDKEIVAIYPLLATTPMARTRVQVSMVSRRLNPNREECFSIVVISALLLSTNLLVRGRHLLILRVHGVGGVKRSGHILHGTKAASIP